MSDTPTEQQQYELGGAMLDSHGAPHIEQICLVADAASAALASQ